MESKNLEKYCNLLLSFFPEDNYGTYKAFSSRYISYFGKDFFYGETSEQSIIKLIQSLEFRLAQMQQDEREEIYIDFLNNW